ncbi:MAG TPA: DUF6268 family outer membrane beta-barrel protein, partial [Cytophagaceae bacterium]
MKIVYLIITILLTPVICFSQEENTEETKERKYCDPQLEGMARSKGIVLSYERVFDSGIKSTSKENDIGNSSSTLEHNNRFDFKLRLPVYNRPHLKVITGIEYYYEEFKFKNQSDLEYDFYNNLDKKHLKAIGLNVNVLKPLNEVHYIITRVNVDLNGDYNADDLPTSDFLNYSVSGLFGWKTCPTKTIGFGLAYSYKFGDLALYPAFLYFNTFNKHFGLEALFPAYVKLRYNLNVKTLIYIGYEIEGSSYRLKIDNPPFSGYPALNLRTSQFKGTIEFEREIHDWLWFGVYYGFREYINFNLVRGKERSSDALIRNNINMAP